MRETKLVTTRNAPKRIRLSIATTLISASQNSISPKWPTLNKLTVRMRPTVSRAGNQTGEAGHQNLA